MMNKFFVEVMDVDVRHTDKYDLFLYELNTYYDTTCVKLDKRITLACFNNPLDIRVGQRYYIKNLAYNDKFKNYLWIEESRCMPIIKNDLWSYM